MEYNLLLHIQFFIWTCFDDQRLSRQSTANFLHSRQPHLLPRNRTGKDTRQGSQGVSQHRLLHTVPPAASQAAAAWTIHLARARQRLRSQASLRKSLWLSSANELTQACRSSGGSFFLLLIKWEIVGVACGSLLLTCLELMKHKFQCILLFYIFNER